MNYQLGPSDLNALERLEMFLTWDQHILWKARFQENHINSFAEGAPLEIEQFQMELEILINDVLNELYNVIKMRYSDSKEHQAQASFYGMRLRKIHSSVHESSTLSYYEDIIRGKFRHLEERVLHHLGLNLQFSTEGLQTSNNIEQENEILVDNDSTEIERYKQAIHNHFSYWTEIHFKHGQIMTESEFGRFETLLLTALITRNAPTNAEKFSQLKKTSNGALRYKFYELHTELFGTKEILDFLIDFMREVFSQMSKVDKAKFSVKPQKYPY